jgi:hypothetical protein
MYLVADDRTPERSIGSWLIRLSGVVAIPGASL